MATPVVERSTGTPVNSSGNTYPKAAYDFTETKSTAPSTTKTAASTKQTQTTNQSQTSFSSTLNTTPEILAALQNFIYTSMDRPVVSLEQAKTQYPSTNKIWDTKYGWIYQNPETGSVMSAAEAQKFDASQLVKAQQVSTSSGVVQGGTVEQRAISDARIQEIARNRALQGDFSKEAAITTAKGLTEYFSRMLTEQAMPAILRGQEAAGASGSTTGALLAQQAVQRTSEVAAKTGADLTAAYGNIDANLANTLEALTRQDPNGVVAQLLQALNIGKGIAGTSVGVQNTTGTQTTEGTTDQVANTGEGTVTTIRSPNERAPSAVPGVIALNAPAYTPASKAGAGYVLPNADSRLPWVDPYADLGSEELSAQAKDRLSFYQPSAFQA